MSVKHTELPWRLEGPDDFGDYNILPPAPDVMAIGAVVSNLWPSEQVAANAQLIVTAVNTYPVVKDLVDALEKAEALYQVGLLNAPDNLADDVVRLRRSALAKFKALSAEKDQ